MPESSLSRRWQTVRSLVICLLAGRGAPWVPVGEISDKLGGSNHSGELPL